VILQSTLLSGLDGVRHAFFTREGGVSKGLYDSLNGGTGSQDDPADVAENRLRMTTALGVAPDRLISAYQIHSADAAIVDRSWVTGTRPRVDGFATKTPGYAIAAAAADCTPILFADADARVIGAAHAGWKGALTGIVESTVAAMEQIGAKRGRIAAAIGPLIRQPNYEVGPEFVARFVEADTASPIMSACASNVPRSARSTISAFAPMPTRSASSATAARCIAPNPTMAGTSTPSRFCRSRGPALDLNGF
jgi:YfiH family protein